jgi:hypothetical protein
LTLGDVFIVATARGVRLVITGDELRAQGRKGAVNDALRNGLVEHKRAIIEAYGDGIWPDETLPNEIVIPAHVPNETQAIRSCIDAQRVKESAA